MLNEIKEGLGPHYLRTDEALQRMFMEVQNDPKKIAEIESDAWEDFLDMTMSQAHIWASQNIDPSKTPSELILTEPYLMGIARLGHRRLVLRAGGRRPRRATSGATTG